jgi:50S ribosomal protein L16 3-hydroxylase
MRIPDSFFGDLSVETFLSEYWQKKPLLVRGAWPGFESPLTPDEFLNLSSREDAFSRLLVKMEGEHNWDVREGPFRKSVFDRMPESQWTLLIQEVDRLVPEVREMLEVVSFLPNWRLDDVMISYAANGGGVGAHIDNYDVFLLQGHGKRRWQINTTPVVDETLIEDIDVSILADFVPDCDWVLEPGDMLYLPPRVAHHGVALGPCMTFSIGCRAPGAADMMTALLEKVMGDLDPDERFADPEAHAVSEPGLVGEDAVRWVQSLLERISTDTEALTELVGTILSEPKRMVEPPAEEIVFDDEWARGRSLRSASRSQVLYTKGSGQSLTLFAGGEVIELDSRFLPAVQKLVSVQGLKEADMTPDAEFMELLEDLFDQGTLVFH